MTFTETLDRKIVDELMDSQYNSHAYIQRRYKVNYHKAIELHKMWRDRQPKELTFEEKLERFIRNPIIKKAPTKIRKATFFIKGQHFHTWKEALTLLGEAHE